MDRTGVRGWRGEGALGAEPGRHLLACREILSKSRRAGRGTSGDPAGPGLAPLFPGVSGSQGLPKPLWQRDRGFQKEIFPWGHCLAAPRLCQGNSRPLTQPLPLRPALPGASTTPFGSSSHPFPQPQTPTPPPPLPSPTDLETARTRGWPSLLGTERRESADRTQRRPAGLAASALAGEGAQSSPPPRLII